METIRDCAGNPINYTDPTGHWKEKIHHEMTEKALKKSKHKKLTLKHLKYGSALPDKLDKYKGRYWHGHTKSNVHQDFLNKGIRAYRKKSAKSKKSKESLILLGTYLHSVQDWYAHSYLNSKGDLDNLVKNLSAAEKRYHEDYTLKKNGKPSKVITDHAYMPVHTPTKDNVKKDWINNRWVNTKKKDNNRYNDAIEASKKFINDCFK